MPRVFIYFLFLPILGWAQESPIAKAIKIARRVGKVETFPTLFTLRGTTPSLKNARGSAHQIQHLTIAPGILSRIRNSKHNLMELSIPTNDGKLELELLPVDIFAPGFTVKTSKPDPNFKFDSTKLRFYQGSLKNNSKAIAAFAFSDDNITGMIIDSTGVRVLSRRRDNSVLTTDYALYDEQAVTTQSRPFSCATVDSHISPSPQKKDLVSGAHANVTTSSTCVKYVGLYLEADYALFNFYSQDINLLTHDILFLLSQVITVFRNENVYVQLILNQIDNDVFSM
ncbi:hypothetical protein [Spirosoma litoris]